MSRIGRQPIVIPSEVEVRLQDATVSIKGPKGELTQNLHPNMRVERRDGTLVVSRPNDESLNRALHGLTRTLLHNIVEGVTKGYQKSVEIVGVGYRAQKVGEKVQLQVGYSHPIEVQPPAGIRFEVEGTNRVHVHGIDKQLVGQVTAQLRRLRPPDPYKGKGIRYLGEKIKLKPGKTAAKKQA